MKISIQQLNVLYIYISADLQLLTMSVKLISQHVSVIRVLHEIHCRVQDNNYVINLFGNRCLKLVYTRLHYSYAPYKNGFLLLLLTNHKNIKLILIKILRKFHNQYLKKKIQDIEL